MSFLVALVSASLLISAFFPLGFIASIFLTELLVIQFLSDVRIYIYSISAIGAVPSNLASSATALSTISALSTICSLVWSPFLEGK